MELVGLTVYPVKSCRGIPLREVMLDRFGPAGDRRWMVVDAAGRFVSQRESRALALVQVEIQPGGLRLVDPDGALEVAAPGEAATERRVRVWEDHLFALDAGDAAADWMARRTGRPCRLVYMPETSRRLVDGIYARKGETVSFADGFPLLLISTASLEDLNGRLEQPVPMDRFRPNLVVDGCEPFAEDGWKRIRIGEVELIVAKPCSRCVVPSIDQATGERDPLVNRVLASYRRHQGQVYFGQNLLYQSFGTLRLGDPVEVLE